MSRSQLNPLRDHLEKLRYFVAVAQAGSLAKAAKLVSLTQPSLSHAIKVLEQAIGAKLLMRSSKGVTLTESGKRLFEGGQKILSEVSRLESDLGFLNQANQEIVIGTKEPYAIHLWPDYLKQLDRIYPQLSITLSINRSNSELIRLLQLGQLSAIMIPEPDLPENLLAFELFSDRMAFYQKVDLRRPVTADRFFIFREGMCAGLRNVGQVMKKSGAVFPRVDDVNSYEVALAMALKGLGAALLPNWMVSSLAHEKQLVEVQVEGFSAKEFGKMKVCLCLHEDKGKEPSLRGVLRHIKKAHSKK